MGYLASAKKIGHLYISHHARKMYKERFGNRRIGARKAKNQSRHRIDREIKRCIQKNKRVIVQSDGKLRVITKEFTAIVSHANPTDKVLTLY